VPVLIYKANLTDVDALAPLFDDYRVSNGASSDPEGCLEFLSARLTSHESCVLAAAHDCRVVGFANLFPRFASLKLKRNWILNDLYVCSEERRHGIARKLLEASKALASEYGADTLTVATTVDNFTAKALYLSFGFKPIEGIEAFALTLG
jgi:GNAT superfamily N-acetyltransferase